MVYAPRRGVVTDQLLLEIGGVVFVAALFVFGGVVVVQKFIGILGGGEQDAKANFDLIVAQIEALRADQRDYAVVEHLTFPANGEWLVWFDKDTVQEIWLTTSLNPAAPDILPNPLKASRPNQCAKRACLCMFSKKSDWKKPEGEVIGCNVFGPDTVLASAFPLTKYSVGNYWSLPDVAENDYYATYTENTPFLLLYPVFERLGGIG